MSHPTHYFHPEQHDPEPFLGARIRLPELEGYGANIIQALENPILSPEQAEGWCQAMEIFASGYDLKLDQAHWGVMMARTLEALFWKVLDLADTTPRWSPRSSAAERGVKLQVFCEGLSFHNLARDLNIYALDQKGEFAGDLEYPGVEASGVAGDQVMNNRLVHDFWRPISPILMIHALAAWGGVRFSPHTSGSSPRRFTVDIQKAREEGPLVAMGSLLGPAFRAQVDSQQLAGQTPPAPGKSLQNRL